MVPVFDFSTLTVYGLKKKKKKKVLRAVKGTHLHIHWGQEWGKGERCLLLEESLDATKKEPPSL